ncbi:MAG: class I SAM-dependent methyltransferase [Thermoplasmata archaeon]
MARRSKFQNAWLKAYERIPQEFQHLKWQQKKYEIEKFFEYVQSKNLHRGTCIEIGRYHGASTVGLCELFDEVISIDILKFNNEVFKEPQNSVILVGDSKIFGDVIKTHAEFPITCLFIDGDHSYEGVKKDYELYYNLVKYNGIIVFHDIVDSEYHRSQNCYVSQLWNELEGEKIEIIDENDKTWGGIGILVKHEKK